MFCVSKYPEINTSDQGAHEGIRTVVTRTCYTTSISRHLFPAVVSAHIFIDICHHDTCYRDRCFATDISRHLLPKKKFASPSPRGVKFNFFSHIFNKCRKISVAVTSVAKYLSRNICRSNKCQEISVGYRKVG